MTDKKLTPDTTQPAGQEHPDGYWGSVDKPDATPESTSQDGTTEGAQD